MTCGVLCFAGCIARLTSVQLKLLQYQDNPNKINILKYPQSDN